MCEINILDKKTYEHDNELIKLINDLDNMDFYGVNIYEKKGVLLEIMKHHQSSVKRIFTDHEILSLRVLNTDDEKMNYIEITGGNHDFDFSFVLLHENGFVSIMNCNYFQISYPASLNDSILKNLKAT